MHGLRGINNLFEGGTRSDFIILGNPEHSLGRVRSSAGRLPGWDAGVPPGPKRSIAADRLRRSGWGTSAGSAPGRLSVLCRTPSPWGPRGSATSLVEPLVFGGASAVRNATPPRVLDPVWQILEGRDVQFGVKHFAPAAPAPLGLRTTTCGGIPNGIPPKREPRAAGAGATAAPAERAGRTPISNEIGLMRGAG